MALFIKKKKQNLKQNIFFNKKTYLLINNFIILLILIVCSFCFFVPNVFADTLSDKRKQSSDLQKQIDQLNSQIKAKQQEAVNLESQITSIDKSLQQIQLELQKTKIDIDNTQLEIEDVERSITKTEDEISRQKKVLGECIRTIYEQKKIDTIQVLASSDTLSDFVDNMEYVNVVEDKSYNIYGEIKKLKEELQKQKMALDEKKNQLVVLKSDQEKKEILYKGQIAAKQNLLNITKGEESNYQSQLASARAEQASMNAQISGMLNDLLRNYQPGRGGSNSGYIWPMRGIITAPFGYSSAYFSGVFHTGIDIAAPSGTPIVSATNGVVYRAGSAGGYGNCVMVVNGSHLVIYGHMSGFACSTGQNVSQGQIIGYEGSTGWSTGPHLHFEIRENFSTPVDPLNYLP